MTGVPKVGARFEILNSVDSTNNYAMGQVRAGLAGHGDVFLAFEQTQGKGQRGKKWLAEPGKNLLLTIVLTPKTLKLSEPFLLSAAVALACYDLFKIHSGAEGLRIKWPNDLYWQDRKAGGVLIENLWGAAGNTSARDPEQEPWKGAVVGIGMNINQLNFPDELTNPVSLRQITPATEELDLLEIARSLCQCLQHRLDQLADTSADLLIKDYNTVLYKKGELITLRKGDQTWRTLLKSVDQQGVLHTGIDQETCFTWGEAEWIIE